ncbi:hypothetical protein M409DRAFT_50219 [Zasmidium cellare ATCC 36951]|uniref:Uncharacterized protein n=1 Tax=Zasmidium cellare ATCC 36951 TaxID=1080233 RepID=A0A6A6D4F7_ZASCE|nr:uncharacterized protein M409DRAFT_50219 [Zasmidium cellare ATCC 36951]KAF2172536.1 hypothetical protein M409DRAFT_50219 [Zasmidium cellare ATCC 36951]
MSSSTGLSQPSLDQAYETAGNPTDKEPIEKSRAQLNAKTDDDNAVAHRTPTTQTPYSSATPTSMARGIHGAPPGEETQGHTQSSFDEQELDAEQMGAPGEGKVASAVDRHPGASGKEPGLETDLERKKAEQAGAREKVKEEKREGFDVGGVLGQRGGPAEAVGKGGVSEFGE